MKKGQISNAMVSTRGHLITIPLAIQSCVCLYLGMAYITTGQNYTMFPIVGLIGLVILSFISACSVSIQWHLFVNGQSNKSFLISPLLCSLLTYVTVFATFNGHRPITAILCALYAALNTLLARWLMHPQGANEKAALEHAVARRYTIMVPIVCFSIQYIAFGSALVLSANGKWIGLAVYAVVCIYIIIWKCTLEQDRRDVLPINVLAVTAIGIIALCGYFIANKTSPTNVSFDPIIVAAKCIIISVYCGGILSIPILLELAQIHRTTNQNVRNYDDRMRVLSGINAAASLFVFMTWVFLPQLSMFYLMGYAIISSLWILLARHRYEKRALAPYDGNIFSLLFSAIGMASFLSFEFAGVWNDFKDIPNISLTVATTVDIASAIGTLIAFLIKEGNLTQITDHLKKLRLLGFHLITLFIIEIFMILLNTNRARFAMLVAGIEMIVELIIYIFIRYGSRLFNSDEPE